MHPIANKNYDFLFVEPEAEPRKMVKEINIMMGEYQDVKELKKKLVEKYGDEIFDFSYMNELIDRLNSIENIFDTSEIVEEISYIQNVKSLLNHQTGEFEIVAEQGLVHFSDINSFIKTLGNGEKSEKVTQYLKRVSSLNERIHHCHAESINLAIILEKEYKIPCKVVTGYTSYFVSKNRYLHTWNELNIDGNEYVIDSTMNTFINKEGYYLLRNINEKENISTINSDIIVEDIEKNRDLLDEIDLKSYLTCRDEIINEYKAKSQVLKKSNEGDER
ncbi:MAG: hypothetical protein J5881_05270 [Clostridia bacterium]|nr:hypothetical protein [Clostridia bacterium]